MKIFYLYIYYEKLCKSILTTSTLLPCSVQFIQYKVFFAVFQLGNAIFDFILLYYWRVLLGFNPLID